MLGVILKCRRRSKSTGTRSQYASLFGVHRSRRVARQCNPTHAYCCGMVGTDLAGSIGHGAGPFPVANFYPNDFSPSHYLVRWVRVKGYG